MATSRAISVSVLHRAIKGSNNTWTARRLRIDTPGRRLILKSSALSANGSDLPSEDVIIDLTQLVAIRDHTACSLRGDQWPTPSSKIPGFTATPVPEARFEISTETETHCFVCRSPQPATAILKGVSDIAGVSITQLNWNAINAARERKRSFRLEQQSRARSASLQVPLIPSPSAGSSGAPEAAPGLPPRARTSSAVDVLSTATLADYANSGGPPREQPPDKTVAADAQVNGQPAHLDSADRLADDAETKAAPNNASPPPSDMVPGTNDEEPAVTDAATTKAVAVNRQTSPPTPNGQSRDDHAEVLNVTTPPPPSVSVESDKASPPATPQDQSPIELSASDAAVAVPALPLDDTDEKSTAVIDKSAAQQRSPLLSRSKSVRSPTLDRETAKLLRRTASLDARKEKLRKAKQEILDREARAAEETIQRFEEGESAIRERERREEALLQSKEDKSFQASVDARHSLLKKISRNPKRKEATPEILQRIRESPTLLQLAEEMVTEEIQAKRSERLAKREQAARQRRDLMMQSSRKRTTQTKKQLDELREVEYKMECVVCHRELSSMFASRQKCDVCQRYTCANCHLRHRATHNARQRPLGIKPKLLINDCDWPDTGAELQLFRSTKADNDGSHRLYAQAHISNPGTSFVAVGIQPWTNGWLLPTLETLVLAPKAQAMVEFTPKHSIDASDTESLGAATVRVTATILTSQEEDCAAALSEAHESNRLDRRLRIDTDVQDEPDTDESQTLQMSTSVDSASLSGTVDTSPRDEKKRQRRRKRRVPVKQTWDDPPWFLHFDYRDGAKTRGPLMKQPWFWLFVLLVAVVAEIVVRHPVKASLAGLGSSFLLSRGIIKRRQLVWVFPLMGLAFILLWKQTVGLFLTTLHAFTGSGDDGSPSGAPG